MNFTQEDITTYAIGEELNRDIHVAIEEALKTDPLLQKEIAEIRELMGKLSEDYAQLETPILNPEKSKTILNSGTHEQKPITTSAFRRFAPLVSMAVAASFVMILSVQNIEVKQNETLIPASDFKAEQKAPAPAIMDAHKLKTKPQLQTVGRPLAETEMQVGTTAVDSLEPAYEAIAGSSRDKDMFKEMSTVAESDSLFSDTAGLATTPSILYEKKEGRFSQHKKSRAPMKRSVQNARYIAPPQVQPPIGIPPLISSEEYQNNTESGFKTAKQHPLSTFSIDVDTGSYTNIRRFLNQNQLPPTDAIRIEEMINYFDYAYNIPSTDAPFAAETTLSTAPWNSEHQLLRIALKGKEIKREERPVSNIVFLIDVSGSMNSPQKLDLLKRGFKAMVKNMGENDRVAIVVYAGASGLVLPSTTCDNRQEVLAALDNLQAGGSTNGGAGIELAYKTARKHFIKAGSNRVILATDGDFNVGTTGHDSLMKLIAKEAKSNIFLTVLGFGMGNYKEATLEQLANKGNGTYGYIDTYKEARRQLVEKLSGTLITIAKDVKIQIEFNPELVSSYRLIGYENRALAHKDFNDDTKDAGEIGAGHRVTALYELIPHGRGLGEGVDPLKYQAVQKSTKLGTSTELATIKIRYKKPEESVSQKREWIVANTVIPLAKTSDDFRFASSIAGFGMLLRTSAHAGNLNWERLLDQTEDSLGDDPKGLRAEAFELMRKAKNIRH